MAEEKLQFVLELATRATGNGAQQVADDMNRVQAAIARTTDKAKVSEIAYYDLGASIDRTRKPLEQIPEANNKVKVSSRNTSMALLELSRGFEDAQYGIRGVLNNIPSLVLSLGGTAGLAGGISIAAVALSQLAPLFTTTTEKASETADKMKELTARMGDAEGRRFDAVADSIEATRERTEALRQEWDETAVAERDFTAAALSNAEKLAQAQSLIAAALGLQVDRFKELEAIAAREAAKREQAAQAAAAQETEKLAKAELAVAKATEERDAQILRAAQEQQNLATLRQRLAVLQEEKLAMEKLVSLDETRSANTQGPFSSPGAYQVNQAAADARNNLASPQFNAGIEGLQKRIADLEKNLFTLTKDGGVVARAETALIGAQTQLQDTQNAVGINLRKIEETLAADTTLAQAQGLAKTAETFAGELKRAVGSIETTTAQGTAAKDAIMQAASDGEITAREQAATLANLRTLIGLMQTNQEGQNQTTIHLINLQKAAATAIAQQRNDIDLLRSQFGDLQNRR